jgi:hypothetical protein
MRFYPESWIEYRRRARLEAKSTVTLEACSCEILRAISASSVNRASLIDKSSLTSRVTNHNRLLELHASSVTVDLASSRISNDHTPYGLTECCSAIDIRKRSDAFQPKTHPPSCKSTHPAPRLTASETLTISTSHYRSMRITINKNDSVPKIY